ncbi:hypothetical protein EXN51_14985 [Agrobacterium fabrum]|uniref:Uncharacterized protein n=1 Tax=Agrobacterium fabrum (strain C58 / ATCC 33970) TaxID=176299 RepID=Q8UK19_AGRFC|nr:hypothetical protein Atu5305 [Agrobacterium fabrum str. C58]TRB27988.1 hypothetical protein EXN51_14985 [Agrobacterium fabrum]
MSRRHTPEENVLVTYFRHSKPRYSWRTRLLGGVVLQLLSTAFLVVLFCLLDAITAKPTTTFGQLVPCLVGGVAGFHFVALRRPVAASHLSLVALSFLAFGTFYWLVSHSLPDLLLAKMISGFGLAMAAAKAFQHCFFEKPVLPHIH